MVLFLINDFILKKFYELFAF